MKTLFSLLVISTLAVFGISKSNTVVDKSEDRRISGKVVDISTKESIPYASVMVKGTEIAALADYEGYFEMTVPNKKIELEAKYLGYSMAKTILLPKGRNTITIGMKVDVVLHDEVTVSAKAEKNKRSGRTKKSKESTRTEMATEEVLSFDAEFGSDDVVLEEAPVSSMPAPPPPPSPTKMAAPTDAIAFESVAMDMDAEMSSVEEVVVSSTGGLGGAAPAPAAGQLTAGILNDFGKWDLWQDIQLNELEDWQEVWAIRPWDRYPVQLTTQNGYPIIDATVHLLEGIKPIWTARTDNTGKAELWAKLYIDEDPGNYSIKIEYKNNNYAIDNAQTFHEGGNYKALPVQCDIPDIVDIAFVVDATGSMGDEITYLKSELNDVITRSKKELDGAELRLGSVFYRDLGDAYVTRHSHFSTDVEKTTRFISEQSAAGGGDGPEAVEEAFDIAIDELAWSENAAARLLFLVLDAPPHQTEEIKARLKTHIDKAAEMGIRVIPVACSGTARSTEYLMRSFALATNGSYIYLTDDSGIGGSHMKPITDEHQVNKLNDLLVQTITDFATTADCDQQLDYADVELRDTMEVSMYVQDTIAQDTLNSDRQIATFSWKYFPNPCSDILNVQIEGELDYLYLFDNAGKLLRRITVSSNQFEIDLTAYPSGMYHLKGFSEKDQREVSGKVVLVRTY